MFLQKRACRQGSTSNLCNQKRRVVKASWQKLNIQGPPEGERRALGHVLQHSYSESAVTVRRLFLSPSPRRDEPASWGQSFYAVSAPVPSTRGTQRGWGDGLEKFSSIGKMKSSKTSLQTHSLTHSQLVVHIPKHNSISEKGSLEFTSDDSSRQSMLNEKIMRLKYVAV